MSTERLPPVPDRPKCLACGKTLTPWIRCMDHETAKIGDTVTSDTYGTGIVVRVQARLSMFKRSVSFWTGRWGRYGDNFFCGLNCGHDWARVRAAREYPKRAPGRNKHS